MYAASLRWTDRKGIVQKELWSRQFKIINLDKNGHHLTESLLGTLRPHLDYPLVWPWLFLVLAPVTGYSLALHFRPQGSRLGSSFWAIVLFCDILFYCVAPTSSLSVLQVHLCPNIPSSWLCSSTQFPSYTSTMKPCFSASDQYLFSIY